MEKPQGEFEVKAIISHSSRWARASSNLMPLKITIPTALSSQTFLVNIEPTRFGEIVDFLKEHGKFKELNS